ncbi:hypothetical protein BDM02DRAFT_3138197 [Thelephora ganbajun]|uniref:Uncharacterized protein n=1 Tax=Thelephora ganbajun TaxID=370292 RepID=A0ACB6ZQR3_THEGA|nr:hypothetical protein BDM02DRAFT_3138197 [Thelephora ganbajun]
MSEGVPVASLYYSDSPWSCAALITLEEKGYGQDEVLLKPVDTSKGHNYSPEYLRLNMAANLPTLIVPLEKTLSADVESRYKAITDPKKILEFLDNSRSARSHTHTTSAAPGPSLSPATIALSSISTTLIDLLYSPPADPDVLSTINPVLLSPSSPPPEEFIASYRDIVATLTSYLAAAEEGKFHVSEKVKTFWRNKLASHGELLQVLEPTGYEELKKQYLEKTNQVWKVDLKEVLEKVNKELVGPYALGDQLSLADIHLAVWLARIAHICGGLPSDDGNGVIEKIEGLVDAQFAKDISIVEARRRAGLGPATIQPSTDKSLRQSKLAAFWETIKERPSWKKVYEAGLH